MGDDREGIADQVVDEMLPHGVHCGIIDTVEFIDKTRWWERVRLGNIRFCGIRKILLTASMTANTSNRLTMTAVHFAHDLALRHGWPKECIGNSIFFALSLNTEESSRHVARGGPNFEDIP